MQPRHLARALARRPVASPSSRRPAATTTTTRRTTTTGQRHRCGRRRGDRAARRSCSGTRPGRAGSRSPSPRRRGSSRSTGLDVELRFFADYLGSLDAMAGGAARRQHPDAQRHDVRGAGRQRAGDRRQQRQLDRQRRHHLRRVDRRPIEELEGKTIGAEEGVVDHFLLLQGLDSVGPHRGRHRVPRRPHRCGRGRVRRGRVRLRGRVRPVHPHGPGAPGLARRVRQRRLPRHHLRPHRGDARADRGAARRRPGPRGRLVRHPRLHRGEPEESWRSWPSVAGNTPEEYESFAAGTTIFSAEEALAAFADGDDTTSLIYTAEPHQPVPGRVRADRGGGRRSTASSTRASREDYARGRAVEPTLAVDGGIGPWRPRPRPDGRPPPSTGGTGTRGRRQRRPGPAARRHPAGAQGGLGHRRHGGPVRRLGSAGRLDGHRSCSRRRLRPGTPRVELHRSGDLATDLRGQHSTRVVHRLRRQHGHRRGGRRADGQLPLRRGGARAADRLPALHPRQRADPALPAVARHRRDAQDGADPRGHGLLQHPDGGRRGPGRTQGAGATRPTRWAPDGSACSGG